MRERSTQTPAVGPNGGRLVTEKLDQDGSVGSAYLALACDLESRPWQTMLGLGIVSLAAGVVIAGRTVIGSATRM